MPIYEYLCLKCNSKFDCLVRSNSETVVCPRCGKKELRKMVSSFAFNSRDSAGNTTASSAGCGSCSSPHCSTCSG